MPHLGSVYRENLKFSLAVVFVLFFLCSQTSTKNSRHFVYFFNAWELLGDYSLLLLFIYLFFYFLIFNFGDKVPRSIGVPDFSTVVHICPCHHELTQMDKRELST